MDIHTHFMPSNPAGPAAAALIDSQMRHRRGRRGQHRIGAAGERGVRHRPRHVLPPARLGDRAAPLGHLRVQQGAPPPGQPTAGRHLMSDSHAATQLTWTSPRQMTLEAIACPIAGFTAGSIALPVTPCDHTATRTRLTSKSQI
jgi:hypothetical protein